MTARATFIADLLDEHLEELGFLFGRWRAALRDPELTLTHVARLEERVRARIQGVQAPGERAWPRLLERLGDEDADTVFAAAYALLHTGAPDHAGAVLDAFDAADGRAFRALAAALAYAPLATPALERLRAMLSALPAGRGAAAAEALAFHRALSFTGEQLRWFLEDEDADTRRAGWRLAALLGADVAPKQYARAMRDDDPGVAATALEAGAWCGVAGVLSALRQLAAEPSPERLEALYLLAVLGAEEDAARIFILATTPALGSGRFRLVGALGDVRFVPLLLTMLDDPDPATAAAAGAAFARLTGIDVASGQRAPVRPTDGSEPDEFDAEFAEEVDLPDAAKARREWERLGPQLVQAGRLCRGIDVSRPLDAASAARLDMQSRREVLLRQRFQGAWNGSPLSLEIFPPGGVPRVPR